MKFKKLFTLIKATNIEVYSRNREILFDGRTDEVPWNKVEEIKNRQVVMIYCDDNSDNIPNEEDSDTIIVTVEDELKLKGVKNGNC